jgi:hypothetical protein
MINQNAQDVLKKFQYTKNKEYWGDTETNKWTQKGLNKHQSETKEVII